MDHLKVKSSNIDSIGYDPATEEMEVRFLPHKDGEPGRAYSYAAVPYDKYREFLNAPSVGSHFAVHVRACYESHRIDAPKEKEHGEGKETKKAKKRIS
jgi:KTSC domain